MDYNSDSDKVEDQEDDSLNIRKITLRNYQIKILEEARKQNSIVFLPTGSGKTLIAIHVLCSRAKAIRRPFEDGGKRAFFMATTKVLVDQLGQVLRTHTKFKVGCFTGDMNVDCWSKETWRTMFEKYQVLVLTGEILKQILQLKYISPSQISLVVIDECHHAVLDHPYRLVLKTVLDVDPSEAPLILGLSAVLLNSNPKNDRLRASIKVLENTFKGKVLTQNLDDDVLQFSTNPTEKVIFYKTDFSQVEEFVKELNSMIEVFQEMDLKPVNSPDIPTGGTDFKDRNRAKPIKKALVSCSRHFIDLGLYGGSLSTLYNIILLEKYKLLSNNQNEIQALIYARTELNKFRHIAMKIMGEEETGDSIIKFSSDRVRQLIQIIKQTQESQSKHAPTIVFVHQRATAVVLAYLLKRLSAVDSKFNFIKADFIIGSSMMSKESLFLQANRGNIIKQFATGALNILVSTNLLEEGLDIPDCNVVINFDFPMGYPSYFQSKGRARDKSGLYYVFIENEEADKKQNLLTEFKATANDLNQLLNDSDDEEEMEDKEEESLEDTEKITIQGSSKTIVVDGMTAIKAVYRYCAKLPQDRYSLLSPTSWFVKTSGSKKKAFVELPMNCPLRGTVEGKEKENKKLAKRSAFLNTLKKLCEMGELDEDLNPKSYHVKEEELVDLFPHFKFENIDKNLPQPGTSKRKEIYKEKFAESLTSCLPHPGTKCYLHVIDFTVAFNKPELERKVAIYELLKIPVTFAIVSSKKLRKIFQFPLFLDIGRINCDLLVNYGEIVLNESEINDIKTCHIAFFKKVTRILKNSQVFDNRNKENSFYIAPVEKNEMGRFVLNWDLIRCDFCRENNSALVKYNPSVKRGMDSVNSNLGMQRNLNWLKEEESSGSLVPADGIRRQMLRCAGQGDQRPQFAMTEAEYKYFVLVPNYRKQDPPQYYIVNKFCHDMSPLSPFPREDYADYFSYYTERYEIEITNTKQPLLRVTPLYNCSNFNKPRDRKSRRARERFKEYEEHLLPELCDVVPFDKRFWIKALLVPTVLNRISHVYCVEEFRRSMFSELGMGSGDLPEGKEWRPLEVDGSIKDEEDETSGNSLSELKSMLPLSQLKDKTQMNAEVVLDPERHLYEFGLCDLEVYIQEISEVRMEIPEKDYDEVIKQSSPIPPIEILRIDKDGQGPDLAMLVEASTAKSANDIVNYERLEILGDSFLKFATTLYLFRMRPDNEGVLTSIKGKIIGNRNLLYCGLAKKVEDIMNVVDFSPLSDWNPPLLSIPETLVDDILDNNVDTTVLYRFEIPYEEQFSGVLSEATLKKNKDILLEYEKCLELPTNSLLPFKVLRDKTISDCVEALIGTHLITLGLQGAFRCLLWLGILPKTNGSYAELMEKPYKTSLVGSGDDVVVENILSEVFYSELEDVLNYRFKSKAILLEALTHPSYKRNRITDCYQRLEFLGDAVLDFLITSYIYENCGSLTPGQVTDIRSAVVNNVTFACLVVRHKLNTYMLSFNSELSSAIQNFVKYQENRNHVVDENVLILMEENDCSMAESILVPKALGDLFESLAGAIFLDSGNSLETVWNVFYRLMKNELDEFTKTVPKTCVRLLYEISGDRPFYETKVSGNVTKVCCTIYYMNEEIKAHGFGPNKKEAKRSAAKLVLNKILALKKVED